MNTNEIPFMRLYNQGIQNPRFVTPQAAVAWLGAMQGQDYPAVKWAIGLRVPGSTDTMIEQALADKQIVRTWALRGTLHVVAAPDLRWLITFLYERVTMGIQRRLNELNLDEDTLRQSNDLIAKAVREGQALSRAELFAILEANGLSTGGQRGVHMLHAASREGLICQIGAVRNHAIFTAIDETIPRGKQLTRQEALVELADRYFTSHGPTTVQDFAWWAGITLTDARAGLAELQHKLEQIKVGEKQYWWAPSAEPSTETQPIHLLPGFDEYLLGYSDRSLVLDPQHAHRIVPGGNGVFFPIVVHHGQVIGTWKRANKKAGVMLTPAPLTDFQTEQLTAMQPAVQRYSEFLTSPVVLTG